MTKTKVSLKQRAIALDDGSKPIAEAAREIAEQLNANQGYMKMVLTAHREGYTSYGERVANRQGLLTGREYRENWAMQRGYKSLVHYVHIRRFLRGECGKQYHNPDQEKFEQEIKLKPTEELDKIVLESEQSIQQEDLEELSRKMNELTDNERKVITLRLRGLTHKKTSSSCNLTKGMSKYLEVAAISKLRRKLGIEERWTEDGEILLAHILSKSQDYQLKSRRLPYEKIADAVNQIYFDGQKVHDGASIKYRLFRNRQRRGLRAKYFPRPNTNESSKQ